MVIARRELVFGEGTYHCITRCVRRAFLCGFDAYTQKNYDHRKTWIKQRLMLLADIFAIDVAAYAVMSNHLHVVLRLRPEQAETWSAQEVAKRWCSLFPKSRDQNGKAQLPSEEALQTIAGQAPLIETYSERLTSLSWFMRCLNENIARRANREDGCKGRFWEGRFKSIALLDDAAVAACCAYVDLNPIRAGLTQHIERSDFTSIQDRVVAHAARRKTATLAQASDETTKGKRQPIDNVLKQVKEQIREDLVKNQDRDRWLMAFQEKPPVYTNALDSHKLPLTFEEYAELLEWTGRQLTSDGARTQTMIPEHLGTLLERLEIEHEQWLDTVTQFGSVFHRVAGKIQKMRETATQWGIRWLHGNRASRLAFKTE